MSRLIILSLCSICLISLIAGCSRQNGEPVKADDPKQVSLPVVQTVSVTVGNAMQALPVHGVLVPLSNHEAKINAPLAGKLEQIAVQSNQNVGRGQVVARMSTQPMLGQIQQAQAAIFTAKLQVQQAGLNAIQQQATNRTAIAQAEATLAGAQATVSNARVNLSRQQQLFQDGLVAKKDVDDARLAVSTASTTAKAQLQAVAAARAGSLTNITKKQDIAIAQEQVRNAEGTLKTARAQLALATIHSPLGGTVVTVTANNGEVVDTSTTLMTIVDMRELGLTAAVPSHSLRFVHKGQTVNFTTEALPGKQFNGMVTSVGAQVDPASGTVPVSVRIGNPEKILKDDLQVNGKIIVERHEGAYLVPKSAVLTDPETSASHVVVIDSQSVAHIRPVTLGLSAGDNIEITTGVELGERVAVSGQYGLPDGTKVSAQSAP